MRRADCEVSRGGREYSWSGLSLAAPGHTWPAVCSVQYAVFSVQCAVYRGQWSVCNVQCAVCSVQFSVCSVQCAVCSVQCAVCSVQCAVCSVQCAVCRVQSAECNVYFTIDTVVWQDKCSNSLTSRMQSSIHSIAVPWSVVGRGCKWEEGSCQGPPITGAGPAGYIYSVRCAICSVKWTVYIVQCIKCTCAVHRV